MMKLPLSWLLVFVFIFPVLGGAEPSLPLALEIIQKSDEIRSPNKPFRYTLTILEYRLGETQPASKQILDISMRFMKPEEGIQADARSLARFIYPARDKGKVMLSDWYDLWFYTPELRRPILISRQQRLLGQISNGDVIVTNFEHAYNAEVVGEQPCGKKSCYKLLLERRTPEVTYPKIIYLVEKGSDYRPYQASYYSLDDKLIKSVAYQDYQWVLGRERPTKVVVKDARYTKGYSVMEYSDIRLESLPGSYFTKESLQRGGSR